MPIVRSGYATNRRSGSTRAYREQRAQVLAMAVRCAICGGGPRPGDPWEAHHVQAYADSGVHAGNLAPAHRSCNRKRGRL